MEKNRHVRVGKDDEEFALQIMNRPGIAGGLVS